MTEKDWLESDNLAGLLRCPHVLRQPRKHRLFSCACCRQLGRWVENPRLWEALDASERYADGLLKDSGLARWAGEANRAWRAAAKADVPGRELQEAVHFAIAYSCTADRFGTYQEVAVSIFRDERGEAFEAGTRAELQAQFLRLLRDVFGNPFRPVDLDPAWRTSNVTTIARQMYESRDFAAMPILADALMDAGCTDDEVLGHCRSGGPHVRGCWVVDLLLGKR